MLSAQQILAAIFIPEDRGRVYSFYVPRALCSYSALRTLCLGSGRVSCQDAFIKYLGEGQELCKGYEWTWEHLCLL